MPATPSPRRRVRLAAALLAGLAGGAEASSFVWKVNNNGQWNVSSNWQCVSGCPGAGFPNAPGDDAQFLGATTFTATITIPQNVTITVGSIHFDSPHGYWIAALSGASIRLDGAGAFVTMIDTSGANASHRITAPLVLARDLVLVNGSAAGRLELGGDIRSGGGTPTVRALGGLVRLSGSNSNTWGGDLYVDAGTVELAKASGSGVAPFAVPRNLYVGDGIGEDRVEVMGQLQMSSPSSSLDVRPSGRVRFHFTGSLRTGAVVLRGSSSDAARLELDVPSTLLVASSLGYATTGNGAVGASITGGSVNLAGSTVGVSVADGSAAEDLVVTSTISNGGLTKTGAGNLVLTGENDFLGGTSLLAGTLTLRGGALASDVTSAAGVLVVGGGARLRNVSLGGRAVFAAGDGVMTPRASTRNLTLGASATFRARIDGPGPSGSSRIDVAGAAFVDGSNLEVVGSHVPTFGETYTIVSNDQQEPVMGSFASLPDGSHTFHLRDLRVRYGGGDGNDVTLDTHRGGLFHPLPPCRLLDTRGPDGPLGGPILGPNEERVFPLVSSPCGGIPADAHAITAIVTAVAPTADGFLHLDEGGSPASPATVQAVRSGRTRANNAIVRLSPDGQASVRFRNESTAPVHVILDGLGGYFR